MQASPSLSAAGRPRLAYLDGLRGWMALVVVLAHVFRIWLLDPAQLARYDGEWLTPLFKWTPLGVVTDGIQAVYVFFAISGLALTYPILRSATPERTLALMTIWRYPRLTVPILMSCLAAYLLLASGALLNGPAASHHANATFWASLYDFPPDFLDMMRFALWRTYAAPLNMVRSWNTVLWTMPVEFDGSLMMFALLAFVRWRWLRLTVAAGLALWWCSSYFYGYFFGFFVGYALAELLVAAEREPKWSRRLVAARPLGWLCLAAAIAASLCLQAESFGKSRNFYMLPMNLIAMLSVTGVALVLPAQARLSSGVSRFLGRISFGLYLTHILVICSFSSALYLVTIDALPYWLTVTVVGGLSLVATIGTGYVFTLLVEERLLVWLKRRIAMIVNPALDAVHRTLAHHSTMGLSHQVRWAQDRLQARRRSTRAER